MANIMDMFRQAFNPGNRNSQSMDPTVNPNLNPALTNPNAQQQQQQQQQNPANPQATGNPQNTPNKDDPKVSPGDEFKDLWTIDPKQKGPSDLADFNFTFDPAKVDANINALDFTKAITPDLLAKIAGGGPDALTATLAAMNVIGQQAARTALLGSTKITEAGIRTAGQRAKDTIPHMVRNESVSSALREDNPLFNDPSTAPMMELVTQQMAQKFPNATPQELRESAKRYMLNMADAAAKFSGKTISDPLPANPGIAKGVQVDWSSEPV